MGEPIRGFMEVAGETIHSVRQIPAREDRATETEKTKIEAWLEENYGAAVRDLIGNWGGEECWDDDAEELLTLLFGDEQQRVEAEAQSGEP
jgi:hypothetical protein